MRLFLCRTCSCIFPYTDPQTSLLYMVVVQNNETRTAKLLTDIQSSLVIQEYMQRICTDMHGVMQAYALDVSMKDAYMPLESHHIPDALVVSAPKQNKIVDHIPLKALTQMENVSDVVDALVCTDNGDRPIDDKRTSIHTHVDTFDKIVCMQYNARVAPYTPLAVSCGLYLTPNMPNTSVYTTVYHELMYTAARGNIRDSGWVFPGQVLSVLAEGNARERCFVLSNLLFKDPHTTLMCWLLSPERSLAPSSINEGMVREYRDRIHTIVCKRHLQGARDALYHVRKMLCGKHTQRNKKIRFPRARDDRKIGRAHV